MQGDIDIIKDLRLESLPEEEKDKLIAALSGTLQTRISIRVMEILSQTERMELEKIIESGDDEKAGKYIMEKVPGFDSILRNEAEKFREEIISSDHRMREILQKKS